jgi:hypothetical protein
MSDIGTTRHIGLGLSLTAAQEQFSKAFIVATASLAGCSIAEPRPDDDSIDWTFEVRPRRASGSLADFASRTIFPLPSTTHTLLSFSETSIPT